MTRADRIFIILVVASFGIWGCSQGQTSKASSRHEERIKALEAKCEHLDSEYQTAVGERDQAQKKVDELENQKSRLVKEIAGQKVILQERDELKAAVTTRTSERDAYQVQLEELRKGIRGLLSRVESALPPSTDQGEKTSVSPKL